MGWLARPGKRPHSTIRSRPHPGPRHPPIRLGGSAEQSWDRPSAGVGLARGDDFGTSWIPRLIGALVAGCGIAIREWSVRSLGSSFTQVVATRSDQALVVSGPYRYVRHPGYAGSLATLTGLGLTLGNWGSLCVLAAGTFIGHLPRIRVEESTLEEVFGERYRQFERERKRLIPGVW